MKKLYRKSTVHPSPSSSSSSLSCTSPTADKISLYFLPPTILTLSAALSAADREVLAYLLSCSTTPPPSLFPKKTSHYSNNNNHAPCFTCYCFTCYTSYWARWDSSPNRQLIHEIIDAFEDYLAKQGNLIHSNVTRKAKRKSHININIHVNNNKDNINNIDDDYPNGLTRVDANSGRVQMEDECCGDIGDETEEKQSGSVRKIVSFIGERIWGGIWG